MHKLEYVVMRTRAIIDKFIKRLVAVNSSVCVYDMRLV